MRKQTNLITSIVLMLTVSMGLSSCASSTTQRLVTIADARQSPAEFTDTGDEGDSVGDILTFDQPLLDHAGVQIGTNSGVCIRTRVGHSFQCQWTLVFNNGSIQVAGREFDEGTSNISIVGGTGIYSGIAGEMQSDNNKDGTFTQTLIYRIQDKRSN